MAVGHKSMKPAGDLARVNCLVLLPPNRRGRKVTVRARGVYPFVYLLEVRLFSKSREDSIDRLICASRLQIPATFPSWRYLRIEDPHKTTQTCQPSRTTEPFTGCIGYATLQSQLNLAATH